MPEREHVKKGFVHWESREGVLMVGRLEFTAGLLVSMGVIFFLGFATAIGLTMDAHLSPWYSLLGVPFLLTILGFVLWSAYRGIKWFVMQWVYVFQPWKRPEKPDYYGY